jgi:hypothetical protein
LEGDIAGLPHLQSGAPLLSKTWVIVQIERYEGEQLAPGHILDLYREASNSPMHFGLAGSGDTWWMLVHKSNSARFYPAAVEGYNCMTYTIATVAGAARSRERVMSVIRAWHALGGVRLSCVICPALPHYSTSRTSVVYSL